MKDQRGNRGRRKPESLRRRHLSAAHRHVQRPHNPSVARDGSRRRRGPGPRARRSGRSVLAALPWLGGLAAVGAAVARGLDAGALTWLLAGGAAGALLARPARALVRRDGDPRATVTEPARAGVAAVVTLGLGLAPGLCALGGGWGWTTGLAALALGGGALGIARGEGRAAWIWRAAGGLLLVAATVLLARGVAAGLDGKLVGALLSVLGAGGLALVAWAPLALLAVGLADDPSAERDRTPPGGEPT